MNENWRPVKGYEGLYEVSNMGRVRSLDRISLRTDAAYHLNGKILSGRPARHGYLRVALYKDGKCSNHSIHRLVATAFCFKQIEKDEVNHKNAIKTDNRAENLEWANRCDNMSHASRENLIRKGEQKECSKLKNTDIIEIRNRIFNTSYSDLAREYGVCVKTIRKIVRGSLWKHIPYENKQEVLTFLETSDLHKRRGVHNKASKLTEKEAKEIKGLRGKEQQRTLAALYGVSQSTINAIQNNRLWGWV